MTEYLPDIYTAFRDRYPRIVDAQGALAKAVRDSAPFDERTDCLLKLALAIGAGAEGAVRSNTRKGLEHGLSPEALMAVPTLAITTCGFPAAIAGFQWVREVLSAEAALND